MTTRIIFLPDTLLLVPGVSGRTPVAVGLRDAARDAVGWLLADAPDAVVVLAPGRVAAVVGDPAPDLGASGVPETWVPRPDDATPDSGRPRVGAGASAALLLLEAADWRGPTTVAVVEPDVVDAPPPSLVALAAGPRTALVVVGSGSARHGPDAPLADDPDAPGIDAMIGAALESGDLVTLGTLDPALCRRLAVTGQGPWAMARQLVSSVPGAGLRDGRSVEQGASEGGRPSGTPGVVVASVHAEVVHGAAHAVARWTVGEAADTTIGTAIGTTTGTAAGADAAEEGQ